MKRLLLAIGACLLIGSSAAWAQGAAPGSAAIFAQVKQYLREQNVTGLTEVCTGPDAKEEPNFQQGVVKAAEDLCKEEGQPLDSCTYLAVLDQLLESLRAVLPPDEYALWQAARLAQLTPAPGPAGGTPPGTAFSAAPAVGGGGGGGQQDISPTTLR